MSSGLLTVFTIKMSHCESCIAEVGRYTEVMPMLDFMVTYCPPPGVGEWFFFHLSATEW